MNVCPLSSATMSKFTEFDEFHSTKDLSCCVDLTSERFDKFLSPYLVGETRFDTQWLVFMFTSSHRQNHIKHRFSTNKDVLVVNLQKCSLKSQRLVYDHNKSTDMKVKDFVIAKELIKSCKAAYSRYIARLTEKKKNARGNCSSET